MWFKIAPQGGDAQNGIGERASDTVSGVAGKWVSLEMLEHLLAIALEERLNQAIKPISAAG